MADCNPLALAENVSCLTCFDAVMEDAVTVQLLDQMAGGFTPSGDFRITDDGTTRVDDSGNVRIVVP